MSETVMAPVVISTGARKQTCIAKSVTLLRHSCHTMIEWLVFAQFLFVDSQGLNKFADLVVPIYTLLVCFIIYLYRKNPKDTHKGRASYNLAKKGANKSGAQLTWKQKFAGTWDKVERTGFTEFIIFMGKAPAFAASRVAAFMDGQPFSNVIQYQDDGEKIIKIDAIGKPDSIGPWVEIGSTTGVEVMVDNQMNYEKVWWDEDKQTMLRTRECPSGQYITEQTRVVNEKDQLILTVKTTKTASGANCTFAVVFDRAQ